MVDDLSQGDLFQRATPACKRCGAPVVKADTAWRCDEPDHPHDREWTLIVRLVCDKGCRIEVDP